MLDTAVRGWLNKSSAIKRTMLIWMPLPVLLACAASALAINSTGGFGLQPQSQEATQGDTARFFCQCPRDALLLSCSLTVNGRGVDGSPGIEERIEGPNDNLTSVLIIPALPEFNGSRVQCVATLVGSVKRSQVAVLTIRDAVAHLTLQSSTAMIMLSWELLSTDHTSLRIDVYSQNDVEPVRSDILFPNQTEYTFSAARPDPSQLYTCVLTPMFVYGEVGISRNGTSANVTGYFLGVPPLSTASVQVDVKIFVDQSVLLTFSLDNAVPELVTTGHRVDRFSVRVENDEGLGTNCSGTVSSDSLVIDNSTLSFSLSCSDVPVRNHLTAVITATNPAGSTSQTTRFSTSPLQNIAIQQCGINASPECQFVVKFETKMVGRTAAVVLVHAGLSDIHIFVDTFSTCGERGEIAVYGLPGEHYSLSLLALHGGVLDLVYEGNVSVVPTSSGVPDQRTEHLDKVTVQPRSGCVLLECTFLPDSPATGCGVLLVNLFRDLGARFFELQRENGRITASECVDVEEEGRVTVVTFAYVNSTLSGRPYIIKDQYVGMAEDGLSTAEIVGIVVAVIVIVGILLAVAMGAVYYVRQRRPGRHDDDHVGSSSPSDGNPGGNNDGGGDGDGKKGNVPDQPQYNHNEIIKKKQLDDGREESDDSGHGTQTPPTSSDADVLLAVEIEDDPPHFHNSQPVQTREDRDALVISTDGGTNTEGGVYKQEESIGSGNYLKDLLPTLKMSRHVVSVQILDLDQNDSLPIDTQAGDDDHEMSTSEKPFFNPCGSDETQM